ncbi:hypothetical protein TI05_02120 [Achromatium sp. WMS3]|nr:hypothetical protein TI05_02120 [Achromatium sp. WMS3]
MKAGWEVKTLGELFKTGAGGTPLKSKKEYYDGGSIPWILSGEVSQGEIKEAKNFINQKGLENSSARIFPKNTVLVAMYGATAGQVGILRFDACTNQAVCGILPNDNFISEFVLYFLLSRKNELLAQATGNAQPNISQIKIKNIDFPVVSIPEQQRIVKLLDTAFACIATVKANTEQNLKNARALFDSYLHEVFSKRGEGWEVKTLGEVCNLMTGGTPSKSNDNYFSGNIKWLVSGDIHQKEIFDCNGRITEEGLNNSNAKFLPVNSVMMALNGQGKTRATVAILRTTATCNQSLAAIIPKKFDKLLPEYLYYNLHGRYQELRTMTGDSGNDRRGLNMILIRKIEVPIPPLPEQQRIVLKLDSLQKQTQRLETLYQSKLTALDELKKALLHKAFNGEL